MSLAADAERKGDRIEIRSLRAQAAGGEAVGSGRLNIGKAPTFAADLKLSRFDPSRFGDYPKGNLNGSVKGSGSLGASRAGSFTWDIADSTLLEQPFASSGRARLAGERLADADAWATLGANRATAKGSFGGPRDAAAWTLDIPELNSLHETVSGQVQASGTARGTWSKPEVTLRAEANELVVPGVAFDTAALNAGGTLDAHEGDLKARNRELDLSAKLKGGWSGGAWRGEIVSFENAGERAGRAAGAGQPRDRRPVASRSAASTPRWSAGASRSSRCAGKKAACPRSARSPRCRRSRCSTSSARSGSPATSRSTATGRSWRRRS